MRKRLQIALMASTVAATSLLLTPQLRAADGEDSSASITTADEHGRKIYVNDSVINAPVHHAETSESPRRTLMYWSSKDKDRKSVV